MHTIKHRFIESHWYLPALPFCFSHCFWLWVAATQSAGVDLGTCVSATFPRSPLAYPPLDHLHCNAPASPASGLSSSLLGRRGAAQHGRSPPRTAASRPGARHSTSSILVRLNPGISKAPARPVNASEGCRKPPTPSQTWSLPPSRATVSEPRPSLGRTVSSLETWTGPRSRRPFPELPW